jgi:hypothetical protein
LDRSRRGERDDVTVAQIRGWDAQVRGAKVANLDVASSLRGTKARWEGESLRKRGETAVAH